MIISYELILAQRPYFSALMKNEFVKKNFNEAWEAGRKAKHSKVGPYATIIVEAHHYVSVRMRKAMYTVDIIILTYLFCAQANWADN